MAVRFNPEGELEKLYLLEILVDSLHLETSKINLGDLGETLNKAACIVFKVLNHPPMKVCEGDFCGRNEDSERSLREVLFKSGKSCLFSLRNSAPPLGSFKIRVFVELPRNEAPNIVIGKGCADLGENFLKILNCTTTDCELGPITQGVRDKYAILNENNENIGSINVFVRLSCFGKMIITQFQISDEEKETFFFKGNEKKIDGGAGEGGTPCEQEDTKCIPCSDIKKPGIEPPPPYSGYGQKPPTVSLEQNTPIPPAYGQFPQASQCGGLLGAIGGYPGLQELPPFVGGLGGYGMNPFPGGPPTGLLGGNPDYTAGMTAFPDPRLQLQCPQFDMNYQKPPSRQPQKHTFCGKMQVGSESSSDEEVEEMPPPQVPLLNFCSCDYPLPPGFTMPQPAPPKKKKKNKKKKPACPYDLGGKFCMKPQCPMGYPLYKSNKTPNPNQMEPEEIALMADRVILQMTPYRQQNPLLQQFPMVHPFGTQAFGMQPMIDPRDMYSLKVGRVMAGNEQNSKVEVAFQSMVQRPTKPCRHHAETQYIPEDYGGVSTPPDEDKGKKKTGAKGKGNKKGKKK